MIKQRVQNARDLGHKVIEIPDPLNDSDWKEPLEKGIEKYLSDVEELDHDARGVYEKAKVASDSCKV